VSVAADADVALEATGPQYVSRGALKLERALDSWAIDPAGLIAVDIGASTGGFTDLLLQRGAQRVYAVDVGYGQLHYKLRTDPRVVSMERTNARSLAHLPEQPALAVVDVAFISLRLVLPPLFALLTPDAPIVALVKPQFEAGREHVHKGGVVRDARVHRQVLVDLVDWSSQQPWRITDVLPSPITGPAGNVEFLSRWAHNAEPVPLKNIEQALAEAAIISAGAKSADHP
jgi:23S rRNA (cytidine1920-2'-O)/16S rRNA (cytidine1409-2'-O)-methyltransferase